MPVMGYGNIITLRTFKFNESCEIDDITVF